MDGAGRMSRRASEAGSGTGRAAAAWTLTGVAALFTSAVLRLGSRGVETIFAGLAPAEWAALVGLTIFFVYTEGIMTFQKRWVPKLVDRARGVRTEPWWLKLLAPLYGMSLVGAPAGRVLRAWIGTALIVLAIVLVRSLPEPWRGIVDFAVAAALGWGLVSIALQGGRALRSG